MLASNIKIVAVVLAFNEERHLSRCLDSLQSFVNSVLVVDCFSTDKTVDIAKAHNARIVQKQWINYATQFNWALKQLDADTDWVLRIDADEIITRELSDEIVDMLPRLDHDIDGIYINRRMTFQGRLIQYGGVFPVKVLRLFRYKRGECENRWMDEHIKVCGPTVDLKSELVDDNLNSLTWWTDKHNKYASREVVDLLNLEYCFMPHDSVAKLRGGSQAGFKRWLKEKIYSRLPNGFRSLMYFFYRYVIRLGFLDGQAGFSFHFLQGLWYRYLVDAKVAEVERYARDNNVQMPVAIERVLGIKVDSSKQ